jgi:putative heme iron utilization protein
MLLSSLLDNHKTELLGVVKAQEVAMQERIGREIKGHLDELRTMHQKTIQEEVKAAIKSSLKDLQKHADDKIIAGLNAGTQAIQDSVARGLEETKTKIEGGMLRSLADELSKSNDEVVKRVSDDLVKRVSDDVVKRVSDNLNADDGRLGKILRIAESGMQGLSSKLEGQESSVTARLNSLETIAGRYHTSASAIAMVLRPLRDSVNSLQSEITLLDLIKINTSRILDIIQPPRPKGDAQVEVRLVAHCM